MDNKIYDFSNLQKKEYGFFINPAYQILVNEELLSGKKYVAYNIEVSLTIEVESTGFAQFSITDTNNLDILEHFPLLADVEIKLGYLKNMKTVFTGVIIERTIKIINNNTRDATIICLDLKSIFRMENPFSTYSSVTSISSLVQRIIQKYLSSYHLQLLITSSSNFSKPITMNQNGITDFEFIMNLAKEIGYEFFVLNKEFYFRKPNYKSNCMIIIEKNSIYTIKHRSSLAGIVSCVEANGYYITKNIENTKICNKVPYKIGSGLTGAEIINGVRRKFTLYESLYIDKRKNMDLQIVADNKLQENSMSLTNVEICINGLPEIIPGRNLIIQNVEKGIDNTYYVEKVRHTMSKDSYRTILSCQSNTV